MRKAVIHTQNLGIGYSKTRKRKESIVLDNLNIDLFAGQLTCLLGVNGVGKSTLIRTLSNMQPPIVGDVFLYDKKIASYKEKELSSLLGLVLTDKTSAGGLSVKELVALGRYPYTGFWGRLSDEDNLIVEQAMKDVGINHKADNYVSDLSDGEKQKVMIAKALAQECSIIILDEPTAFLDVVNRFEIMNLLHRLAVNQNKAILLSTHDLELAFLFADCLWLMSGNKPLKTGTTEDLILSDSINEYITTDQVFFDQYSGRFISKEQTSSKTSIRLIADNDNLYYWTTNFLTRNGFKITNDSDFSVEIEIKNSHEIYIVNQDKTIKERLSSYSELADYLSTPHL